MSALIDDDHCSLRDNMSERKPTGETAQKKSEYGVKYNSGAIYFHPDVIVPQLDRFLFFGTSCPIASQSDCQVGKRTHSHQCQRFLG